MGGKGKKRIRVGEKTRRRSKEGEGWGEKMKKRRRKEGEMDGNKMNNKEDD